MAGRSAPGSGGAARAGRPQSARLVQIGRGAANSAPTQCSSSKLRTWRTGARPRSCRTSTAAESSSPTAMPGSRGLSSEASTRDWRPGCSTSPREALTVLVECRPETTLARRKRLGKLLDAASADATFEFLAHTLEGAASGSGHCQCFEPGVAGWRYGEIAAPCGEGVLGNGLALESGRYRLETLFQVTLKARKGQPLGCLGQGRSCSRAELQILGERRKCRGRGWVAQTGCRTCDHGQPW